MRKIEILRTDWERVRRARPTFDEDKLVRELLLRGRRLIREEPQESILPDAASEQRLAWLRRWTPRKAASIATLGFELAMNRDRLSRATEIEQLTTQRYEAIHTEVIPSLKRRAEELRGEIQRLESELRERGRDPGSILPRVPPRIEVDDYQPVEFEGQEEKRKTLEFFRRIGGDR